MLHVPTESNNPNTTAHLCVGLPDDPAAEMAEAGRAALAMSDEPNEAEQSAANVLADIRSYAARHGVPAAQSLVSMADTAVADMFCRDLKAVTDSTVDAMKSALAAC